MYLTIHQHLRLGYITETTTVVSNLVEVLSQNQINLYQMTCALFRLLCRSWLYIYTFNILNIQNPVSAIVRGQYCFTEPTEMFGRCHWRLGTLIHTEVLQLLNNLITARKRSLQRLCFYTCLSVHRWGVVSQHALQVVSQHALQVSGGCIPACLAGFQAPSKRELEGFGQGEVSRPTNVGYPSMHWRKLPGWWLLLRAVRILLECTLVVWFSPGVKNRLYFLRFISKWYTY